MYDHAVYHASCYASPLTFLTVPLLLPVYCITSYDQQPEVTLQQKLIADLRRSYETYSTVSYDPSIHPSIHSPESYKFDIHLLFHGLTVCVVALLHCCMTCHGSLSSRVTNGTMIASRRSSTYLPSLKISLACWMKSRRYRGSTRSWCRSRFRLMSFGLGKLR